MTVRTDYRVIADSLRTRIRSGEFRPGEQLPAAGEIAAQHGVNRNTVIRALSVLEGEGLVTGRRGRGTFVRERAIRTRQMRGRFVHRDERGYFFDLAVRDWVALHPTEISTRPVDADVAGLLGVEPGEEVLVRYRRLGPAGGPVGQVSASFLPGWVVAEIPQLGLLVTGPGGIYDLLEQGGHAPLLWDEVVWSRMPTPEEAAALLMDPGVPALLVGRTSRSGRDGRAVEVNVATMAADRFEVGYQVQRASSAELGGSSS